MRHALVASMPADAIDDIAGLAGRGSALAIVQFRHMGGALARHQPGAGARATLPGEVIVMALGVVPEPAAERAVYAQVHGVIDALAHRRVGAYPNFVEEPAYVSSFFAPATWERLRQIKALYDPQDVFKGNHPIPPA
jgi:FAD/FMN-containing dehydrogenase